MPVRQVFIVRRDSTECFRALQQAFGTPPVSAKITWDRRQGDRRRRVLVCSERRRLERRRPAPISWSALDFLVTRSTQVQRATVASGSPRATANRPPTSFNSRTALDHEISDLRDLPYSFWCDFVTGQSSFTRPLSEVSGRVNVDAGWHQGTRDIHVTITLKRGWRRRLSDGFTITPTNRFR